MIKKQIGLYLGASSIGAVVVENKKIVSSAKFDLSSVEEEAQLESLSEDVKWEALINKALREVSADSKEVYVSLADKDFIFRAITMPLMKKREIRSSLVYEVEKHIPFKVESLKWDFGYASLAKEKKMNVSFVGMKEESFNRVQRIFSHLELKPLAIEPSCLSLTRVLKSLKNLASIKNFALLDFKESEAYLTFFNNDLPVFNRYLIIPKKEATDLDKFIESVRMSIQYFKREFRSFDIDKFIVMSESAHEDVVSRLKEDLELDIETVFPQSIEAGAISCVENVKALGVAGRDYLPYKFKPILRKTEEEEERIAVKPVRLKVGLLGILIGIGVVTAIISSTVLGQKYVEAQLKVRKEEQMISIPKPLKDFSWKEVEDHYKKEKKEVDALKEIKSSIKNFSPFLEELPATLPEGLWLDSLEIRSVKGGRTAKITGYIFRDDSFKERIAIDEFVSELRKNEVVKKAFGTVEVISSERKKIREFELTFFAIKLE